MSGPVFTPGSDCGREMIWENSHRFEISTYKGVFEYDIQTQKTTIIASPDDLSLGDGVALSPDGNFLLNHIENQPLIVNGIDGELQVCALRQKAK